MRSPSDFPPIREGTLRSTSPEYSFTLDPDHRVTAPPDDEAGNEYAGERGMGYRKRRERNIPIFNGKDISWRTTAESLRKTSTKVYLRFRNIRPRRKAPGCD